MKKRPGIFDPWRQEAPPPVDETPARRTVGDPLPGDESEELTCVQFNGIRAGIYVWIPARGTDPATYSAAGRSLLVDLLHRIYAQDGAAAIFKSWGIYLGEVSQPNPVVLGDGPKKVTVSVAVADDRTVPRAVDNLTLALREVSQRSPAVSEVLSALKVRPYLK